jgi:hypothetical protein
VLQVSDYKNSTRLQAASSLRQFVSSSLRQFVSSSVRHSVSSSVRQFVSSSVRQFVSSSVRHSVSSSVRQFVTSSVRQFVTSSVRQFVSSSVRQFVTSSVRQFVSSSVRGPRKSHTRVCSQIVGVSRRRNARFFWASRFGRGPDSENTEKHCVLSLLNLNLKRSRPFGPLLKKRFLGGQGGSRAPAGVHQNAARW